MKTVYCYNCKHQAFNIYPFWDNFCLLKTDKITFHICGKWGIGCKEYKRKWYKFWIKESYEERKCN